MLAAPTGSGKSTQVPQMLLDSGLARSPRGIESIVVLEPRRVAARTLAARVAWERGRKLGTEVGYQIRFEDQTSAGTKISFVTEGILLRWLQDDPELQRASVVIFDEFHERNLLSDVALGLIKRLQASSRPDLLLLVMSATLEVEPLAAYLDDCPVLTSEGQMFPVQVNYQKQRDFRPVSEQAAEAVERIILSGAEGDILVFMPGMAEIHATLGACRHLRISEPLALIPLHGDLPAEQQDAAFAPNQARKVIVSTNVAETSVTIDGVRHVVDSGLARIARFDAERGLGTLLIEQISRASAEQRKGRAGRTAPGTCWRLWTESGQLNRAERNTPEIQRADLAEVVLLLHSMGVRKAAEFDWLDKPEHRAVERAEQLLQDLGAIAREQGDVASDLTVVGRKMLRLPLHPRYSRMLVEAAERKCVGPAALCAALASGRDLFLRLGPADKHIEQARETFETSDQSDFFVQVNAFEEARKRRFDLDVCRRYGIHANTAMEIARTFQDLLEVVNSRGFLGRGQEPDAAVEPEQLQKCIIAGFVDQLCIRKDKGTLDCVMADGRAGVLMRESVVRDAQMFVPALVREVAGKGGTVTLLGLATAARPEWIREMFAPQITIRTEHIYDRVHKRVAAIQFTRLKDLVLEQEHQRELDPEKSGEALARAHLEGNFDLPQFHHELKQFMARVNLVCKAAPELEFPPYDRAALSRVLARAFRGLSLAKEAQAAPLKPAVLGHLAPEQIGWLEELAPLAVPWPDGRKLKLLYPENSDPRQELQAPELQVKLHETFELADQPSVCEGKVPLKLWLCAPDGKRLAATSDWPKFKTTEYPRLKPALVKNYPGFNWR